MSTIERQRGQDLLNPAPTEQEQSLRPRTFDEYVGQEQVVAKLKIYVEAAKGRKDALDHCLFSGPPGLGKTSLAFLIARELGVHLHLTSGPALEKRGDLAGLLMNLGPHDVLFVDEIHRLNSGVEEYLYPAMEDYRLDITIDSGPAARAHSLTLPRFTLIGATTRTGLLTSPLRDRFHIQERLEFYTPSHLVRVLARSATILGIRIHREACELIARRSRGTPRIANRLLRRLRDFADVAQEDEISEALAEKSLGQLDIDARGLDRMDRRILESVIDMFAGGPVGVDTLATAVGEERETIEDVYEPYLIQEGFLMRTPRGRVATKYTFDYFGRKYPSKDPGNLFEE